MAIDLGGFVQLLGLLQQRRQAEQQGAVQQQNANTARLGALQSLLQAGGNSQALAPVIQALGLGLDSKVLSGLTKGVAPSPEAYRVGQAQQGAALMAPDALGATQQEAYSRAVTGDNQAGNAMSGFTANALGGIVGDPGLNKALTLRTLLGTTAGAMAQDQAIAGLPASDLTTAAQYGMGLKVTPAQQAANTLQAQGQQLGYAANMATNRLGWAQLAQQGQLGLLGLQVDSARVAAGMGRGNLEMKDAPELLRTKQLLITQLGKAGDDNTRAQLGASLEAVDQLLRGLGVTTDNFRTESVLGQGHWWESGKSVPTISRPAVPPARR